MMKVPQVLTILAVAVGTALGAASVSEIER